MCFVPGSGQIWNVRLNDTADLTTNCLVDVIFVVDESGSVGNDNYELVKSFLSDFVAKLDIESGNTRVGLVPYSTDVDTAEAFNLNTYSSVTDVQDAINSLTWTVWYARTYTNEALEYVRTTMLTSAAGDRPDVPNVVVVLTDGQSTDTSLTEVCIVYKLIYMYFLLSETIS